MKRIINKIDKLDSFRFVAPTILKSKKWRNKETNGDILSTFGLRSYAKRKLPNRTITFVLRFIFDDAVKLKTFFSVRNLTARSLQILKKKKPLLFFLSSVQSKLSEDRE